MSKKYPWVTTRPRIFASGDGVILPCWMCGQLIKLYHRTKKEWEQTKKWGPTCPECIDQIIIQEIVEPRQRRTSIMVVDIDKCTCVIDGICECIENEECICACGCGDCRNTYIEYSDVNDLHQCGCGGNCSCGTLSPDG